MVERTFESIKGKESNELAGAVGFVILNFGQFENTLLHDLHTYETFCIRWPPFSRN